MSETKDTDESLLPCPFCGDIPIICRGRNVAQDVIVEHSDDAPDCPIRYALMYSKRWNTRHGITPEQIVYNVAQRDPGFRKHLIEQLTTMGDSRQPTSVQRRAAATNTF